MVEEALLADDGDGLVPKGDGWFVLNARESRWFHSADFGSCCVFEGDTNFGEMGINLNVLRPGEPLCRYHGESTQEDFLILSGECLLLIEGQERPLRAWDLVHCPPWAEHVIIGAGDGPSVVLAAGSRPEGFGREGQIRYTRPDVAVRHAAAAATETDTPAEAYAGLERPASGRYREGDLP